MPHHRKFYPGRGKLTRGFLVLLALILLPAACAPTNKAEEEILKEIQALKAEVAGLKEKMEKWQAGQQEILVQLQKKTEEALAKMESIREAAPPAGVLPPGAPLPLNVSQLFKEKDRLLGTRVTVRGPVGPVLMHQKTLYLKAPEGMVEVFFGSLADERIVKQLTSQPIEQPLTVTGMLSPEAKPGAKLRITAEAVEF